MNKINHITLRGTLKAITTFFNVYDYTQITYNTLRTILKLKPLPSGRAV